MANLTARYYKRLGLDPSQLDNEPTLAKLKAIHEAHLTQIPYENMAQHGARGGLACLDMELTAQKLLDRNRGGFCYEQCLLLAAWLEQLGYIVNRVPAIVFDSVKKEYRPASSHVVLIVSTRDDKTLYYCDVGFAEPPLHPLKFEAFGEDQETAEGMVSRLVREDDDWVVLYWFRMGEWQPRMRWKYSESFLGANGRTTASFQEGLDFVHRPETICSQKMVVCKLTRDKKFTLSGSRLKITGPPRFPDVNVEPSIEQLGSLAKVREVLRDLFGIPMIETEGLDLKQSEAADPVLWSNH